MIPKTLLLTSLLALTALAGCLGDDDSNPQGPDADPSYEDPQPDSVTALEPVGRLMGLDGEPYPSGAGIWAHGDYVFGSSRSLGFYVADISDPTAPQVVWNTTEDDLTAYGRDADVVEHPDGRLTLVIATQSDGMHIYDVTVPEAPEFLARTVFEDASGNPIPNHNVAVVPGTELVFNSRSGGEGSTNDLVDVSTPDAPVVLGTYGTHGCHDITFFSTFGQDDFRAYCAGIERTEIWDLNGLSTDAADFGIGLVATIGFPEGSPIVGNPALSAYPARTLHHLAMVNEDGTVLIVGDEQNGGGDPGGCLFYDEATGTSSFTGALWFYDISDEASPQLLSWLSPPTVVNEQPEADTENMDPTNPLGILDNLPSCTAHFGTLVPGEEKLVMAWYHAGVVLIDFSDPSSPMIIDQFQDEGINTWDARIHGGYVFTGDIGRGMDVLKLT